MTPNDTAHNVDEGTLAKRLESELDHLTQGTFLAGEGLRRNGQLVSLEINPRWVPGDQERGEPEERLDLEILVEPHAPVLETPPAVVEGMFDACKEMMQDKNPRIRKTGKEERDQLQQQLDGPRLSRSHLSSLTFLLSREAAPSWIYMLPAGSVNTRGRARFEYVASDAECQLRLIDVPQPAAYRHKDPLSPLAGGKTNHAPASYEPGFLMRAYGDGTAPLNELDIATPGPPSELLFELRDRRVSAQLRREEGDQAVLVLGTRDSDLDGVLLRYAIGERRGEQRIAFPTSGTWHVRVPLGQKYGAAIAHVPNFELEFGGKPS